MRVRTFAVALASIALCFSYGTVFADQQLQLSENVQSTALLTPRPVSLSEIESIHAALNLSPDKRAALEQRMATMAAVQYYHFSHFGWDVYFAVSANDGIALDGVAFQGTELIYYAAFPYFGLNDDPCNLNKFELSPNELIGGPWLALGLDPVRGPFVSLGAYYRDGVTGAEVIEQYQFYPNGWFIPVLQYWHPTGQSLAAAPLYVDFDLSGFMYDVARCPAPDGTGLMFMPLEFADTLAMPLILTDQNNSTVSVTVTPDSADAPVLFVMNYWYDYKDHPIWGLTYPNSIYGMDNVIVFMPRNIRSDLSEFHDFLFYVTP
ncbi:MAG: hypothetical protein JSV80_07050 [Acidobacteriota bacterium]|nr:MAG: hypothetical protein JSV80_07050 [Acidobacteriota bacterium]